MERTTKALTRRTTHIHTRRKPPENRVRQFTYAWIIWTTAEVATSVGRPRSVLTVSDLFNRLVVNFLEGIKPADVVKFCEVIRSLTIISSKLTVLCLQIVETARSNGTARLFFCGVGKSGLVATYLAATFTALGYSSFALDTAAARWGDIASLMKGDVMFLLSKSGSTEEIIKLIPFFRKKSTTLVAITCVQDAPITKLCETNFYLPLDRELCPFNLSPTTSPLVYLIFADLCKNALLEKQSQSLLALAENYPEHLHGRQLTLKASDIMYDMTEIKVVDKQTTCFDALTQLNESGHGFMLTHSGVHVNHISQFGVFTDGDLRRAIGTHGFDALYRKVEDFQTGEARYVFSDDSATQALNMMNDGTIVSFLLVVDRCKIVQGIVTRHQIIAAGLIE